MHAVGFLLFDGMTLLDFTGPMEVFSRAPGYEVLAFSPSGGTVRASNGVAIAETLPVRSQPLDTVIIVGADDLPDAPIDALLGDAARVLTARADRVASVCTGAFILAELGLLDGRRTTTHWRHTHDLARRFPAVRVDHDTLHVHDGRFHSSAGITAGIDLALALVEQDHDADTARAIAREMVVFMHRPGGQTQFAASVNAPSTSNPLVHAAVGMIRETPSSPHTTATLSKALSISERQITRLFKAELGQTPAAWIEHHRLGLAQQAILDGHTVTAAAQRAGYGSDESLRRSFRRILGVSPSEYRARFRSTFR